ncbi:G-protein alpha subunit-domain-containing protein [Gigaspora rosea]|uniref:G-protein alpha subunit-domain-containing protein n=1 Tax=Gigaspora rosea TaxID=44941 RepID=A0A397UD01_9GLOM|nr:G-protein alpha subunit-domain-containing protein [Gigaspora rosea]
MYILVSIDSSGLKSDPAIKKCYNSASEIGLQDSAKYFLDNVSRFGKDDYLPTDEDILQARIRTVGVAEHKFEIADVIYNPYFDDVNAIIFMAAISAFDQTLEDSDINRVVKKIFFKDPNDYEAVVANSFTMRIILL